MNWKATWKYLPVNYGTNIGTVENITQRTVFSNNLSGEKVKIRFSNKYGKHSLVLDKVAIARLPQGEQKVCGYTVLTKGAKEKIVIGAGEEFYSDAADWTVAAGEDIVLFVYMKEKQPVECAASVWSVRCCTTRYRAGCAECPAEMCGDGWRESREIFPYAEADVNKPNMIVGVTGIMLYTDDAVKTVALFGDSITHMSYFSDALLRRFMKDRAGRVAVVNCGIGGNRLLRDASFVPDADGNGACFGAAGVRRFERDVFSDSAPDLVVALEGVNDIMHPHVFAHADEIVTAAELEKGMRKIIDICRTHGALILAGTVMPFWDDQYAEWFAGAEEVRNAYNRWLREKADADGVIDYAAAVADENNHSAMRDGLHIGDGLHPNTKGGEVMAELAFREICDMTEI